MFSAETPTAEPAAAGSVSREAARSAQQPLEHRRFAALAFKLLHRAEGAPIHVAVTSSQTGEGVSTVAASLAESAAAHCGSPVLLIDAHLAGPTQHRRFGLSRTIGLADILHGAAAPDCIQRTDRDGLHVLAAGTESRACETSVSPAAFRRLLDGLNERYGMILIDAPPVGDSVELCSQTHGAILVVEAESVRRQVVLNARDDLQDGGANLLGVVLNKRKQHVPEWLYRRL